MMDKQDGKYIDALIPRGTLISQKERADPIQHFQADST